MPTPSIQTLRTDAQQVLNLDSISAVRSVVAATLANANAGTPLNPNLTTQQLWNEFYQIVTQPKSDIESIIANQLMKFLYAPPAPGGAGANGQVIFNDGGVLAGDAGLTYNKTTDALTITGDLTVDTNVLKVDSTNNRVSVNTTTFATDSVFAVKTPSGKFDVRSYGGTSVKLSSDATMGYNVATGGEHIFQINDSNQLTLNALGLGLGASPSLSGGSRRALTVNASTGQLSILELAVNGSIAGYLFSNASQTTLSSQGSTFFSVETNSTERLRIDSAGNCGIGVTPSAWSAGNKFIDINSSAAFGAFGASDAMMIGNAYWDGSSWIRKTANNAWRFVIESVSSTPTMTWQLAANGSAGSSISSWTQAMTLDASGVLMVGTTNSVIWNTTNTGCVVGGNAFQASRSNDVSLLLNRIGSNGKIAAFAREGLEVGDISVTTTGTTFNSTSDYRLKEAVAPLSGGLARVNALKPSIYNWKSNGSTGEGFLAHELAEVVPAAVTGEKDAVNEDGSIKAQSIDMSRVVPILVAAIQELTARVQTLEAK